MWKSVDRGIGPEQSDNLSEAIRKVLWADRKKIALNRLASLAVTERAQSITEIVKQSWTLKRPPVSLENPSKDDQVCCLKLATPTNIQEAKAAWRDVFHTT